jgi:putative transposase
MLLTPTTETGVSSMMQYLGRSYVKSFNRIYQRTGTLWEGRFRSLIVDTEQYLFACYRYIELNPVRAGLVIEPQDYPWSSYSVNALGSRSALIKPRQEWVELGATAEHRHRRYREMFDRPVADDILNELRTRTR